MSDNFKATKKALIASVSKATSSSVKPPKEKHIRRTPQTANQPTPAAHKHQQTPVNTNQPNLTTHPYVAGLYLQTYAKDDLLNEEILRALCKRLDKESWVVVLKTLIVFHRCFREGDPHFIESLRSRSNAIFALRRFTATAPQGPPALPRHSIRFLLLSFSLSRECVHFICSQVCKVLGGEGECLAIGWISVREAEGLL